MSGSNALAAAKRRRGGSDNKGPAPPGSRNTQNSPNGPPSSPPGPINPLQLIAINHQRLNKLSDELPKTIDALGESFNALSSNCDYLHEQFNVLENDVSILKLNNSNTQNTVSRGVDADKFNKLESDNVELNKVVARMQSFSMDTNSQLTKLKEDYSGFVSSVNKRFDDLERLYSTILERLNGFDNQVLDIYRTIDTVTHVNPELITTSAQIDVSEADGDNVVNSDE